MALGLTSPGRAAVCIDGQYGSTGKGLIAAYIALQDPIDIAVTNAAPNAGHTTIWEGKKFVAFHLPTAAVVNPRAIAYLDAGAVIDPEVFKQELIAAKEFNRNFNPANVFIHPRAAVLEPEDTANEKNADVSVAQIAGTKKGVGSAIMRKISRKARLAADHPDLKPFVHKLDLNREMEQSKASVLVEVPQGFGLGINSGFAYPHCTSRDVTVTQALADAGIHPHFMGRTLLCLRTYPIRVGNVYDSTGSITEYSGPHYEDQTETTFEALGVEPERTTVTKRVRRVFTWSQRQYEDAMGALRPDFVFLNFVNYLKRGELSQRIADMTMRHHNINLLFGIGPDISEIYRQSQLDELEAKMGW